MIALLKICIRQVIRSIPTNRLTASVVFCVLKMFKKYKGNQFYLALKALISVFFNQGLAIVVIAVPAIMS